MTPDCGKSDSDSRLLFWQGIESIKVAVAEIEVAAQRTTVVLHSIKARANADDITPAVRTLDELRQVIYRIGDACWETAYEAGQTVKAARSGRAKSPRMELSEDAALKVVRDRPHGAKVGEVAQELGVDTDAVKPLLRRLRDERKLRSEGMNRGMRYFCVDAAVASGPEEFSASVEERGKAPARSGVR